MYRRLFDKLAEEYPLFRDVWDGNTTLEETVQKYEVEFYRLSREATRLIRIRGKDKFRKELLDYNQRMSELVEVVKRADSFSEIDKIDLDKYIDSKRVLQKEGILDISAVLLYCGLVTMPLGMIVDMVRTEYCNKTTHADSNISDTEAALRQLKREASKIDDLVHKTYITMYIRDKPELFIKTYQRMGIEERERVKRDVETQIDLGVLDISRMDWERFLKNTEKQINLP